MAQSGAGKLGLGGYNVHQCWILHWNGCSCKNHLLVHGRGGLIRLH